MVFKRTGFIQCREIKSRRDGALLTVDFNLRTRNTSSAPQSPAGTTLWNNKVLSLHDFGDGLFCAFRRLKPTVNQVLSLRDISSLIQYFYKFFISRAIVFRLDKVG